MRTRLLELLLIALIAIFANRYFLDFDNDLKLYGNEAEWLTSSALWVSQNLHDSGSLPLWQPYLSRGQPTIDTPFAFVLNPVSTLPSVFFGYPTGIKLSVVLTFILSGWGGWLLGAELGLSRVGRILMGMMLVVRGPAHTSIGFGYFQLGTTQLYLPWAVAATVALIRRPRARWPVVLLALTITLIFWGGNIYYTLPTIIIVGVLVLFHAIDGTPAQIEGLRGHIWLPTLHFAPIWRLILALVLGGFLAAATLLPIFAYQGLIGRHPDEHGAGIYADPLIVVRQVFDPVHQRSEAGTWNENYYVYTMPVWLGAMVFLILPLVEQLMPPTLRSNGYRRMRFWTAGIVCLIWFLGWGTATNPVIAWMYDNFPLIGQWRVVGRMLTVVSMWVVIFAVLNIDSFVNTLYPRKELADLRQRRIISVKSEQRAQSTHNSQPPVTASDAPSVNEVLVSVFLRTMLSGLIVVASFFAVIEVSETRDHIGGLENTNDKMSSCVYWLRQQFPDEFLSAYTRDYFSVTPFIRNHVRLSNINADFDPLGLPTTLYKYDLTEAMPPFMLMYDYEEHKYWSEHGYKPIDGSPPFFNPDLPCVYYNPNTLSYAFLVSLPTLERLSDDLPPENDRFPLDPGLTLPIDSSNFNPGKISFTVESSDREPFVAVLQEVAWPGWMVTVDGQPAKIESVGQLIGVVLPADGQHHSVEFVFTSPLLLVGGGISLVTFLFCGLYLLRMDTRLLGQDVSPDQPATAPTAYGKNGAIATIISQDLDDWGD